MKRSRNINLALMRKNRFARLGLSMRVTLLGSGAAVLAGCSNEEGVIYQQRMDCVIDNPDAVAECESAYQQAKNEWLRTAPRFSRLEYCEDEFGDQSCEDEGRYFLPMMAGFMLYRYGSDALDLDFKRPKPLTRSFRRQSPLFGKWVGAGGRLYGNVSQQRVRVSSKDFRPLKGSRKVLGRGGFGQTVSSSRSSWGG